MSARDHRQIPDSDSCVYCLEPWPCPVQKIRIELAEELRNFKPTLTGSYSYDSGKEDGLNLAADHIEGI